MMGKELQDILSNNREIGVMDNPQFDKSRKCHDWRNYVPVNLRKAWKDLTYEARIACFIVAKKQADSEDWD